MKKKWTDTEIENLQALAAEGLSAAEAAKVLGRTSGSVSAKAALEKISFDSGSFPECTQVRAFVRKGGVLLREDIGAAVGVRWCAAHRSAGSFDPKFCERLLEIGVIMQAAKEGLYVRSQPEK